jgi:hypothetical protein
MKNTRKLSFSRNVNTAPSFTELHDLPFSKERLAVSSVSSLKMNVNGVESFVDGRQLVEYIGP